MHYKRTIQHEKRRLLIECYTPDNTIAARIIAGRIEITKNSTIIAACENSLFKGDQFLHYQVETIDSYEGLFTVYYKSGARMEITRYREEYKPTELIPA